ncbi:MAG: biotin-dependent carboxyltransferase family protein [Synergistaceae bacterium]|jgi:biotin-dependent carboxylase-like uncharacterized protein|nr:biotin-dependent carboxyltransferase family protein [Synergistaceae bacterium]
MRIWIEKPGMFSTVQDLGRRGYQMQGVPVAGAMDTAALRLGNILVGNDEGAAGLEITMTGPLLKITEGEGCFAVTGAEAGITKNGVALSCWTAHKVVAGDALAFTPPKTGGSRAYFCVGGGIDVPLVMGSRSTYTRGKFGGYEGRALRSGDTLASGETDALQAKCEGLECPPSLRPNRDANAPLRVIPGPQDDRFTEEGLATFYASEYVITNSSDRMGCRMEGPEIAHKEAADIISDAICSGSVQVPGHGQPIVMLADRQTTGGYTKIATVCAVDVGNLAQRLPGQKVRFKKITVGEAVTLLQREAKLFGEMKRLRAAWRSKPAFFMPMLPPPIAPAFEIAGRRHGVLNVRVDGVPHHVEWERLE